MAKLSPKQRLQRAIKRIERTGWCQWHLRCGSASGIEGAPSVREAPVCALGSLITDKEYNGRPESWVDLPGVRPALEAVGESMPKATMLHYRQNAPVYITTWNDELPKKTGKRTVLTTMKRALARLEEKRGK